VSPNMDLSSPVISKTGAQCIADAFWQCDITLDYGTPYYWSVRATGEPGCGAWSEKGVFVTVSESVMVTTYTALSPPEPPTMPAVVNTVLPSGTAQPVITGGPQTFVSARRSCRDSRTGTGMGLVCAGGVALGEGCCNSPVAGKWRGSRMS
jgi:hypothetical protein